MEQKMLGLSAHLVAFLWIELDDGDLKLETLF